MAILFRIGTAVLGLLACAVGFSALSKLNRPVVDAGKGQIAALGLLLLVIGCALLGASWQAGRRRTGR